MAWRRSRLQRKFDLEDIWPQFTGDVNFSRCGIIGDAIEHFGAGVFVGFFPYDGPEVELTDDLSAAGIDLQNIIGLPLIGVDVAFDQFQLVYVTDGAVIISDTQHLDQPEGIGIEVADVAGAITHDELGAIGGHAPAFFGGKGEFAQLLESFSVIDETDFGRIGQLIHFSIEEDDAFAEVFFPVNFDLGMDLSGSGVHDTEPGQAVVGHIIVRPCALVQLAIMEQESFGVSGGIVGQFFHDRIADQRRGVVGG